MKVLLATFILLVTTSNAQDSDCWNNMIAADTNQNGYLEFEEFYQLVQLQSCETATAVSREDVQDEFNALACTSCTTTGDGNAFTCCFRSLEEARVSIAGVTGGASTVQQLFLDGICAAVDIFVTNCEELPTDLVPIPELPDTTTTPVDADACRGNLTAADANGDTYLNMDEFYQYLVSRGAVCDGETAMNGLQLATFQSMACTTCLTSGDGGITCCFRPTDEARISISQDGAGDLILLGVCQAVDSDTVNFCSDLDFGVDLPALPEWDWSGGDNLGIDTMDLESCISNLNTADGDQDGFLNQEEFLQFVLLEGSESCFELPSDTSDLLQEFQALACGTCVANNDGGIACCTRPSNEARISIPGANEASTLRLETETVSLAAVCLAVQEGYINLSDCGGIPNVDLPNVDTPSFEFDGNLDDCYNDIMAADGDSNEFMTADEYYELIKIRGVDVCYSSNGGLSEEEAMTFMALACTSCLASNDGGVTCCSRSREEARLAVAATYSTESMTTLEEGFLTSICAAVEAVLLSESCEDGGSGLENVTTESPPEDSTTTTTAPPPESDSTELPPPEPTDAVTEEPSSTDRDPSSEVTGVETTSSSTHRTLGLLAFVPLVLISSM